MLQKTAWLREERKFLSTARFFRYHENITIYQNNGKNTTFVVTNMTKSMTKKEPTTTKDDRLPPRKGKVMNPAITVCGLVFTCHTLWWWHRIPCTWGIPACFKSLQLISTMSPSSTVMLLPTPTTLSGTTAKVITGFEAAIDAAASNRIILFFMLFPCP